MRKAVFSLVAVALVSAVPTALADHEQPYPEPTYRCGAEGSGPSADDGELRVGTYNILHSQSSDLDDETLGDRLALAAAHIAASGVDVIGLQEVVYTHDHGYAAQRIAASLADQSGGTWHWCYNASNPHFPGEPEPPIAGTPPGPLSHAISRFSRSGDPWFYEGLAVVSRFPITATDVVRLTPRAHEIPSCDVPEVKFPPSGPGDFQNCQTTLAADSRALLHAVVDVNGERLDFYTTHIANGVTQTDDPRPDSHVTKALQIRQVVEIIAATADDADHPPVLTGDFNTDPDRDPRDAERYTSIDDAGWLDSWRAATIQTGPRAPGGSGQTSPDSDSIVTEAAALRTSGRIDHVWVRDESCAVAASTVIGDTPVSVEVGTYASQPDGATYLWASDHFGVVSTLVCA